MMCVCYLLILSVAGLGHDEKLSGCFDLPFSSPVLPAAGNPQMQLETRSRETSCPGTKAGAKKP